MFKFFRRRGGNLRDDNASDIITEHAQINASDSAPILNNRYDLNTSTSVHDLRRSEEPGVTTVERSLSTLQGVFFPVALSMCSVAVFMRVGFIVGNTGVFESIALYALAASIFVFTGLSVCAISTNGAIQGGGIYCKLSVGF